MNRRIIKPLVASLLALWGVAQAQQVGEVSLLIGEARVVHADGSQQPLQRGGQIRVGDRIETSSNGHVHMRFIDNGAVSVRPDSTLEVQAYRYDAQRPELNEVRLRVDKGVSRSISGAATDLDKTRFRLNTPIAAIGVRGTDFIVHTDADGVRATVNDGAIIVGPLSGQCSTGGVASCAGSRELSADMGRLMAEVRGGDASAHLVPAVDLPVATASARDGRNNGGRQVSLAEARAAGLAAAEPTQLESQRGNDRAAAELLTLANVRTDLNRTPDLSGQLVWGRYSILPDGIDKLSVPFALAALGRHVTVADADVILFRNNQSVPGELFSSTLQGSVEFKLNYASASYESGADRQVALVSASNLTVDFTRRTFATGLNLTSASGALGEVRAAGSIRPDGIFTVRDTDQKVSGALSLDGKEAGYLFESQTSNGGLFRGRTLWGR